MANNSNRNGENEPNKINKSELKTTTTTTNESREADADDWHHDDATGLQQPPTEAAAAVAAAAPTTSAANGQPVVSDVDSLASVVDPLESSDRADEDLHRTRYRARRKHHNHHHHRHCHQQQPQHQQRHHHHAAGHIKELIKPDPTVRGQQRARIIQQHHQHHAHNNQPHRMSSSQAVPCRSPPLVADSSKVMRPTPDDHDPNANSTISAAFRTPPSGAGGSSRVAVVVDEQQLQERLRESISEKNRNRLASKDAAAAAGPISPPAAAVAVGRQKKNSTSKRTTDQQSPRSTSTSSNSTSSGRSHSSSQDADDEIDGMRSPPPTAIIIPPNVAKSLSSRNLQASARRAGATTTTTTTSSSSRAAAVAATATGHYSPASAANELPPANSAAITREQLEYGPLLKPGEVQILYRSPEATDSTSLDRHLKEEEAKMVAPNMRQSPIAIMTMNPTYELQNRPLAIEYPARVENLKLNNTGFSWEVKIPYQISMTTSLYGAHLNQGHRYRLDQFHCHWGSSDLQGSEHTVDNRHYSAELHFVHYNMEKYHTMSKAARHPDGLVVLSVFLEASEDHHNHAELEKIVSHLKNVPLKGQHSIIRQAVHVENLLPQNRSYWSYQGSLTTPPYFESVTWFIFKQPLKCNKSQIQRFRNLKSSLRADDDGHRIDTNHRKTQPLNGRSIVNYDELQSSSSTGSNNSSSHHANNSNGHGRSLTSNSSLQH